MLRENVVHYQNYTSYHAELTQFKQDRQRTYNVTMGRVRAAIVLVEKQCVLHILSVCL